MAQPFFDPKLWKYSDVLLDSFPDLLKEYQRFPKWLHRDNKEYNIDTKGDWKFITFIRKGKINHHHLWFFPTVRNLLKTIPIYDNCMFSIIGPGATVAPHNGHNNEHFRVHLAIETDGNAWIRVGEEKRHWEKSKILIFDDYANHEVHNPSHQTRTVFLFDILRNEYYNNLK
jgi:aspartyl/asparaginyl beta-hydroxylase (cupin superfamily)